MAMVPTQMYTGQPGTTDTLLYTVPGGTTSLIKQITLTNTDTVTRTVTLGLNSGGALAAANHLFSATPLVAKSVTVVDVSQVLTTGQTVRALQESATAVVVRISGVNF